MCGIAGFVNFHGHDREDALARVKCMTGTLIHRGPDDEGHYVDDWIAFGHRRLSIIDITGGRQPMGALDDQLQIIFNGEIYNFLELRAELEASGHQFKTHCDTEVILLSYLEWGEGCVARLNGMFAFAIWDVRKKTLLLARDRVGKKPLYIYQNGHTLAFASELKALRAVGLCSEGVDPEALDCYFCFGYIPAPRTIYKGVQKLRAARYLAVSENQQAEEHYWHLSFSEPRDRTLGEATEQFEALFDEAVKCRLMSEVPIGVFLSGGLDSTLVASSMARLLKRPMLTNSIGFADEDFDELPLARIAAGHLGAEHHEFLVEPQAANILQTIAWHFDEPFADSSAVATWYVCEMARRNVTVALSGDGGDESFGGYTFRYLPHMFESRLRAALPSMLRAPVFALLGALWPASALLPKPFRLKTLLENIAVSNAEAFYHDLIWLRSDTRENLYSDDFLTSLQGFTPLETVYPLYEGSDASDVLGRSQFTDTHLYLADDVLTKVDRMSMAHSLEVRSPLLDHRIIEYAATLPARLKINARKGKLVLRSLASRRLPAAVTSASKRGFSIPAARWLRHEIKNFAEDIIFDQGSLISNVLKTKQLTDLWRQHQCGQRDHSVLLWAFMMLALWQRTEES